MKKPYLIIDFDSTFTRVEALDLLAEIVLAHSPRKGEVLRQIQEITNRGMDGELDFRTSLTLRLELLHAHRDHIQHLADRLKEQVSPSFRRNQPHLTALKETVYVVSNGFRDFIVPVVEDYGLLAENVFANVFTYDEKGYVSGFDTESPLSRSGGKSQVIRDLKLQGDVYVIGDGANDLEIRKAGFANKFYLFTENVEREKVKEEADHIAPSVDEILYNLNMSRSLSYPKNRIRVLLTEEVPANAAALFEQEGYQVEHVGHPLSEDELCEKIKNVNVLGVGAKTPVTEKVIANARRLINIGAFCIETGHISLDACTKHGVAVFNAPFSNTRSVVELALAEIILLVRQVPERASAMQSGQWDRPPQAGHEVRGKKLGLVGYGNIGAQLSVLAEAIGLEVYFYDIADKLPLGNARKCDSLEALLSIADIVSLHIDSRPENDGLFGTAQFAAMQQGAIFLNLSYGKAVQPAALRQAVLSGKLGGCGLDVFPEEPDNSHSTFRSELIGLPNTLLTPHIGGRTAEAQDDIGRFVPGKILQYINTGTTTGSVNFPQVQLPMVLNAHRLLHIHHNVPRVLAQIDRVLAQHDINILGQYLKTNEHIGYVITDVDKAYSEELLGQLKQIEPTIWFRVLY
ncbi:MAG: phosphoglycerate dehydrogenase [Phaeodactylibacter sp.]|nr:phosphoglycerate dehydrogenase [Phaeodactylibacter sp.]MCB9275240.1 phosphoglycerate dehydrogenase [Lewinellaceae bacterium]